MEILDILIGEPCGASSHWDMVGRPKKKVGAHFYFSIGAFFIASVDPLLKESTGPGLNNLLSHNFYFFFICTSLNLTEFPVFAMIWHKF